MSVEILIYAASTLIFIWGVVQIYPTKSRSKVIGELSGDNNKIVSMEWIAEGVTFILIAILVLFVMSFMLIQIYEEPLETCITVRFCINSKEDVLLYTGYVFVNILIILVAIAGAYKIGKRLGNKIKV